MKVKKLVSFARALALDRFRTRLFSLLFEGNPKMYMVLKEEYVAAILRHYNLNFSALDCARNDTILITCFPFDFYIELLLQQLQLLSSSYMP